MKCPPNIDRSRLKDQPLRWAVNMTMNRRPRLTRARSDQRRSAYTMTELLPGNETGIAERKLVRPRSENGRTAKGTKTDRLSQKSGAAMGLERSGRAQP